MRPENNASKIRLEWTFVESMKAKLPVKFVTPITILLTENASQLIKKKSFKVVTLMMELKLAQNVRMNNLNKMESASQSWL